MTDKNDSTGARRRQQVVPLRPVGEPSYGNFGKPGYCRRCGLKLLNPVNSAMTSMLGESRSREINAQRDKERAQGHHDKCMRTAAGPLERHRKRRLRDEPDRRPPWYPDPRDPEAPDAEVEP